MTLPFDLLDGADLLRLAERADEVGHHELASRLWLALADRRCRRIGAMKLNWLAGKMKRHEKADKKVFFEVFSRETLRKTLSTDTAISPSKN